MQIFRSNQFNLVLIDVEASEGLHDAEKLCSEFKTSHPGQRLSRQNPAYGV